MDGVDKSLDEPSPGPGPDPSPDQSQGPSAGWPRGVPTYALYGEQEPSISDSLHCESIARRSRLHGWEIRPHRHDLFAQLLLIRSGQVEAQIEDRGMAAAGPALLFVPPLCVHGFRFSDDVDGVVVTVVARMLDRLLAGMPDLLSRFAAPGCLTLDRDAPETAALVQALGRVAEEFAGAAPGRVVAIEASLALALVLVGRLAGVPPDGRTAPSRSIGHVQRFRALVDRHVRDRRDLGFYADRLAITPAQLSRVCRQVLGRSAQGTINARLILEAKRDLAYTALDIKAVAAGLGFADPAYFSRFFARHTGTAPQRFRQAARARLRGCEGMPAWSAPAVDGRWPGGR